MKVNFKNVVFGGIFMLLLSFDFAYADTDTNKIAVVDITKVVSSSKQVKTLKEEQYKKATDLEKWLEIVQKDIQKQSTNENKQKLIKKYDEELAKRREANTKEYTKKLNEVDASVSRTITDYAKSKGYDLVLVKSSTLYGGLDITNEIMKIVK